MLTFMRKHARSWFIKVLLGSIIVVFIFFYGFNLRQRQADLIASVNGTKIGLRHFQEQYQRLLRAQQSRLSELSPEQIRALKEAALEQMIDEILLLEQAEKWNLTVSQGEIREFIENVPAFQEDGHFSYAIFRQYLRAEQQTEEQFTEEIGRILRIQKAEDLIRDSAKITEGEVEALYNLFNEKIELEHVVFEPNQYADEIVLEPDEIQDYFAGHRNDYQIPEKVEVEYLEITSKAFLPEVQVSEQEIEDRYQSSLDRWKESKQVLARHILLRTNEDEDPKARMKVLQKAESILNRLQEGEAFAELAKEYSQDPATASKGGVLGWKRPGELPESLNKAIFEQMSPGELSERPIKSPQGFHILRLDEIKSESVKPLAEVRGILEEEIKQDKAKQMGAEVAEQAYMAIFQGADFQEAAEQFGLPLKTTPPFSLTGSWADLPGGTQFRQAAFSLEGEDDFSDVIEEDESFFILRALRELPSREPELAEVREEVEEDLREIKAEARAMEAAEAFFEEINENHNDLSQKAQQNGLEVRTSPPLRRMAYQGRLPSQLVREAFSLPAEKNLVPGPIEDGGQFYVAMIKKRILPDTKELEEQRDFYRSMLLREKRESTFRDWLDMIRSRSEIKTYKAFNELL